MEDSKTLKNVIIGKVNNNRYGTFLFENDDNYPPVNMMMFSPLLDGGIVDFVDKKVKVTISVLIEEI